METQQNMEYEIDLREIFYIVKRRLWIIALITVLAVTAAGLYTTFMIDNTYQSSAKLIITQRAEGGLVYQDMLLNKGMVKTYSQIAKSRTVTQTVIRNLGLDLSHDSLIGKVNVSGIADTEIIEINVTDNNPENATKIANELSDVFMDNVVTLMQIDNIKIVDRAVVPTSPIGPNLKLNIAIAGVLGIMISLGIIFLIEFLDKTLKSPEDIEKHLGLPVIATIPYIKEGK